MPQELDDWMDDSEIMQLLREQAMPYSKKEIRMAKRAFYAQCTHIDHQIRNLIGTLRECSLLNDTVIGFLSDHGDTLFDHQIVGKRTFYEGSTNVPLILSGRAVAQWRGTVSPKLACLEDVMPTLLNLCDVPVPNTVEGIDLLSDTHRELLYGEIGEGRKATRMATDGRMKLIYYPCGNVFQLFDTKKDPDENHNLYPSMKDDEVAQRLLNYLVTHLHGDDLTWLHEGKLVGFEARHFEMSPDYELYNQRGLHWPAPSGYQNAGKT